MERYLSEQLLSISEKFTLGYKKGCLIIRDKENLNLVSKVRVHNAIKSMPVIERLLRLSPRVAVAISDKEFIYSDHGTIYRIDAEKLIISEEHKFEKGMNNPISFCVRRNQKNDVVDILYGEYIWNSDKGPVSIYRRINNEWIKVYDFPANTITHIHNISFNPFTNSFLILTGDDDEESAIWEADLEFTYVRKVIGGKQKYRSCIAYPTKVGIYYATDTPLEENWLYLLGNDMSLKKIYKMPGPCIYGRIYDNELYLSTSVEGDPTQSSWKYRLSNKLGKGVNDRYTHLIKCDSEGKVSEIGLFKKDFLPMWLFQFGNALFPEATDGLYVCPQSCTSRGTFIIKE